MRWVSAARHLVVHVFAFVTVLLVLAACGDEKCAACVDHDAPAATCAASGSCTTGPMCGTGCCKTGEHCDNGTCRCGMNVACGTGDSCEAAGPIGGDACGAICCGASGPCPQ